MNPKPDQFDQKEEAQAKPRDAGDDLRRFRYHTGATPRPINPDEPCPVLFRDVGPEAMTKFLRGGLSRLAGPFSPITYLRTADYQEPYVDHGRIGRLVFLQPLELFPWHSGVDTIYVASASRMTSPQTLGFVPADLSLKDAARHLANVTTLREMEDVFHPTDYQAAIADTLLRLDRMNAEHQAAEAAAEPLRQALQSADPRLRDLAREQMQRDGITESDLCSAWHHLPDERRAELGEIFRTMNNGK